MEALRRKGVGNDPLLTREPGGSTGAEILRQLLVTGDPGRWDSLTEALLQCAARCDHLRRTVWPALAAGRWVVCDRFTDSMFAYQGGGQGVEMSSLRTLATLVPGTFKPDLTILLDLPPHRGLQRTTAVQRHEGHDVSFHHRVREVFLALAAAEPERCVVMDAGGAIAAVHATVWAAVAGRLGIS
ncbi:MAG: tmk [Rhodospirillaceae bacterium]|nr:MAG: tmk [Rhodospirillaceae bacterium]